MQEYRVKGLSCANCTRELEEQIQKLEHGASATLSYNSGRLRVDPKVPLPRIREILKGDGAYLEAAPAKIRRAPDAAPSSGISLPHSEHAAGLEQTAVDDDAGNSDAYQTNALHSSLQPFGEAPAHDHKHTQGLSKDRTGQGHAAHEGSSAATAHGGHGHGHPQGHPAHAGNIPASVHDGHAHDHDPDPAASLGHHHDHAADDDHDHDHSHGSTSQTRQLIISAVLYGAALLIQDRLPMPVSIILYLAAIVLSGYGTFIKGLKRLLRLQFNMDTLMTVALIGAIGIGEWKEATLVAILFGINEKLEGMGMEKARRSMETLLQVAPKQAILLHGGKETIVPIESLKVGDRVLVRAGEKIPSDGRVVEGTASVNEAAITGESLPLSKAKGDSVFGGSINQDGLLQIEIEKAYEDSSLARILHLVQEAQETKTPTELFINRFAKYYTPAIMIIALLVVIIPPLLFQGSWKEWLYQGLAVLIVGCPCALILASPIAIVAGITRNARHGILIKGGVFLEQLGRINTLAFDKTGTLTLGEPHVERTVIFTADKERFYRIAGAMEQSSTHPLAKAIMKELASKKIPAHAADTSPDIQTASGRGIEAVIEGKRYWLGNEAHLSHLTLPASVQREVEQLKAEGLTLVLVADEEAVLGMFGIADEIRPESREVIAALHAGGGIRRTVMLTGDHPQTAAKVAHAVGVTAYYGGLLPQDKVAQIRGLMQEGRVAMVGDGINDAPALAAAELGIAMGKGTDSAIETADIVLMQDHLGKLPEAIRIARRVNRTIRLNLGIAMGLKLAALLLTIPGWLTLWFAILSDMGATILITLISLTLLIERGPERAV
ncbi:cation-translocating P-type ATPase [Paenibacillus rigui]|uniref:Cd(2+)-exporting ATPase n=1 Tax=Paenibacillus rigui TaxID=554312 RepID=A0A229UH92_9BACL|nr:heavy metal translocating P-type ATPase [Paenibacillus rigui]OXM82329.1 heavy metal translocating P-type ATPase [Paenibacillus rigui]